jgi:hypothetical protein
MEETVGCCEEGIGWRGRCRVNNEDFERKGAGKTGIVYYGPRKGGR